VMVRRKNNDGCRSVHLDPRASHEGDFVDLELVRDSKSGEFGLRKASAR